MRTTVDVLRVVIADDHLMLREVLKAYLQQKGIEVVADVSNGRAAVRAVRRLVPPPDVVLLDVSMPILNGIEAARQILRIRQPPETYVILFSGLDDVRLVPPALEAGVRGFIQKSQPAEELPHAFEEVRAGRVYVSPGASRAMREAVEAAEAREAAGRVLTPRERQVLQLVGGGKSSKQVAEALDISIKTVEFHRGRLMKKLNIHDTANLVRYAIREGWVAP